MRMWMIDPKLLCDKHLLGEHGEIHKHRHNFIKGHKIEGRKGQIEPGSMEKRHDELVFEMVSRGMNHNSPYEQPDLLKYDNDILNWKVDHVKSIDDLIDRCEKCRTNILTRLLERMKSWD